jgi:hypothetical protein
MFGNKSRYYNVTTYQLTDRRGRTVTVVAVPDSPLQDVLGYHVLKQGERLDHLAAQYFNNAAGFWRIAELNDAMLPESLTEASEVAIPDAH